MHCVDSPIQEKILPCAQYVAQGKCRLTTWSKGNRAPCCACPGKYSGLQVRKFGLPDGTVDPPVPLVLCAESPEQVPCVGPPPVTCNPSPDKDKRVCSELKSNNFCWAKIAKDMCSKTCNTCSTADEVNGARRSKTYPDGEKYVGGLTTTPS